MTRTRWWSTVVPVAAIVYGIVVIAADGDHVAAIGAMVLAVVVLCGFFLPAPDGGRERTRKRRRPAG